MRKMDNRLNLDSEVRELKLGSTFTSPSPRTVFHTIKYDFKPASVDVNKPASLEVGTNKQVTVTVPHLGEIRTAIAGIVAGFSLASW